MVRVGKTAAGQLDLGSLQDLVFRLAGPEMAVEALYEVGPWRHRRRSTAKPRPSGRRRTERRVPVPTRPSPPISLPSPKSQVERVTRSASSRSSSKIFQALEQVVVPALARAFWNGQGETGVQGKRLSSRPWHAKWRRQAYDAIDLSGHAGSNSGACVSTRCYTSCGRKAATSRLPRRAILGFRFAPSKSTTDSKTLREL